MKNNSLSVASFNLILYAAQQSGADYTTLCEKVGLTPEMLQDPDARLPIKKVIKYFILNTPLSRSCLFITTVL